MSSFRSTVPPNVRWYDVPVKTKPAECRGKDCGDPIYWIDNPDRPGRKLPVDCDVDGGQEPYAGEDRRQLGMFGHEPRDAQVGRGVNHFATCPNAEEF